MNPKRIAIALSLALIISLGSTWLVSRKIGAQAPAAQKQPDLRFAAPSRPLEAGEVLKAGDLEWIAWPASVPIEGAHSKTEEIIGRELLFPLSKDQPVLDRDLSAAGAGTGMAGKIPDGMRAIALRSDEVVGVAGFLVPGSHVDVLATYRSEQTVEPITTTVLQNAIVLAAGHQIQPDPEGKAATVTVVTLLLTPQESQRAVLASTQGAIHFVLRNGGDGSRTTEAPMPLSQLSGEVSARTRGAAGGPLPGRLGLEHLGLDRVAAVPTASASLPRPYNIETVLGDRPFIEVQPMAKPDGGPKQ